MSDRAWPDSIELPTDKLVWALGRTDLDPRGRLYGAARIEDGWRRLARLVAAAKAEREERSTSIG